MPRLPWIGCELLRLEYDFQKQSAVLYLNDGDCVDMESALHLVEAIDKGVQVIRTVSGSQEDTKYTRDAGGRWAATLPPRA